MQLPIADDQPNDIQFSHLTSVHPCFSKSAHKTVGRIHLPVAPGCNIGCRFCKRAFNQTENRPGVAGGVLSPRQAVDKLKLALELCPQITVAGVAGPGDPLATDHALDTFDLIDREYPQLIKCLSTNGLRLPEKADRIAALGIRTVTVTVNAVDPAILDQVVGFVAVGGRVLRGVEGARRLIAAQLDGIGKLAAHGVVIKINCVLVPGINGDHVGEVARVAKSAGASMINIIPLIPQHELSHIAPPDCSDLNVARAAAQKYLVVFRHCNRCRADAVGIPGVSEFRQQVYGETVDTFSHG